MQSRDRERLPKAFYFSFVHIVKYLGPGADAAPVSQRKSRMKRKSPTQGLSGNSFRQVCVSGKHCATGTDQTETSAPIRFE